MVTIGTRQAIVLETRRHRIQVRVHHSTSDSGNMIPTSNFTLVETSRPSSDFVCCSNSLILAFASGVTHSVPFFGTKDIAAGPIGWWYITDGLRVYSLTFDDVAPQIEAVRLHTEHSAFFEGDFEGKSIRTLVASLQSSDLAILCQPRKTRKSAFRLWESNGSYRVAAIFQDCDELLDIRFVDNNIFAVVREGGCVRVYNEEEVVVAEANYPGCIEAQLSNNGRSVCMRILGANGHRLSVFDRITGEVADFGAVGVFGISADGEMVATLCDEVFARIHEWKSGATTEIVARQPGRRAS